MRQQRTIPTPTTTTPTVLTVNGRAVRDYLTSDREPVRWLVGELDGSRVVWTPDPRRANCARHPHLGACPCLAALAALTDPAALQAWHRRLGWWERRRVHTAALQLTGAPRPRREPPGWTWGLGRLLLLAAALLAVVLLLAPLLHGR
jgi:hypothetical protein